MPHSFVGFSILSSFSFKAINNPLSTFIFLAIAVGRHIEIRCGNSLFYLPLSSNVHGKKLVKHVHDFLKRKIYNGNVVCYAAIHGLIVLLFQINSQRNIRV